MIAVRMIIIRDQHDRRVPDSSRPRTSHANAGEWGGTNSLSDRPLEPYAQGWAGCTEAVIRMRTDMDTHPYRHDKITRVRFGSSD